LETQLVVLAKATTQLIRRRKELAQAHTEFAAAASLVGSCEADLDSFISTSFIRIAQISDHMSVLHDDLGRSDTSSFEEALKDYIRILGAVKDMLNDRDEVLLEYQNASRTLESKRDRLDKGKNKISVEKDIEDATHKVEDAKREYERISALCRRELDLFDVTRGREIRRMITLFVQGNMEHSLQVVDLWKAFISDIHNSKEKESDPKTLDDKISWGLFNNNNI
jgi:hypothetical protein